MTKTYRQIDQIHTAPRPHWVGDGFHVNPMFSHMANDKRTDPFLMLDYASPQHFAPNQASPRGVGQHPHKGFETVTIAYQGEVAHRDSSGGGGIIKQGDTQWMTAGNGVIHEEFHSPEFSQSGGDFEMVQLWVNLPAKDKTHPARYQHLANDTVTTVDLTDETGKNVGNVRLIAGEFIDNEKVYAGVAQTFTPINLWDISLNSTQTAEINVPKSHNLLLLVRHGEVTLNDDNSNSDDHKKIGSRQLVTFAPETGGEGVDTIRLTAGREGVEILLMSGEPINEPIVGYGPFVMNSEQDIRQAILDFNAGKFGGISA